MQLVRKLITQLERFDRAKRYVELSLFLLIKAKCVMHAEW